jgi:ADP-ribose pyrophosphatase YjhB (NUDIX family)
VHCPAEGANLRGLQAALHPLKERMISFDLGRYTFQLRAAAIFRSNGRVLLHRLEGDDYWSLPGGRVEPGEDAATTVVREMQEELGEAVTCGELACVVENFFEVRGKRHHEIGLYLLASFGHDAKLLDITRSHAGVEGDRRLEFRWFAITQLADVDVRPSFLRQALAEPGLRFQHAVHHG